MTNTHPRPATTIRIGRTPDNDIALPDLHVSRHHAELRRNPDGSWELVDVGSHGGTFVNGKRITHADDGKIALITDFWPEPYELPASRADLVERY